VPEKINKGQTAADFSAGQLPKKFLLVHAVLEGFAPIDENDRYLIIELPTEFRVTIHIHFLPCESAASRQLVKALLHHFAKMTASARVHHYLAGFRHAEIVPLPPHPLARKKRGSPHKGSSIPGVKSDNA
jgi:hypothetical protein